LKKRQNETLNDFCILNQFRKMIEPPIVIECPECGEKYLISRQAGFPSEGAVVYSDGYFTDVHNWRTPEIIGCVTCELGFFPQRGRIVAEPNWTEYNEIWAHLKKAEPPTAGSLALEIRARKNMLPEVEVPIRIEFWYSALHTETGRILFQKNEKFRKFWTESLIRLNEIMPLTDEKSVLLKAEINRQLGLFQNSIDLLKGIGNPLASQITEYAQKGITEVFKS
jgi:hypothetical protein